MPHSLRAKLSGLHYKGILEDKDYKRLCHALDLEKAEQEQKSGKWITVTNGRGGHECSLCHEYAPSYQDGDEWLTKYCPNCGAKMVKPQESEDK